MKIIKKIGLLIISVIAIVALLVGFVVFIEKVTIPFDYYFYQYHPLAEASIIYLLVIPVMTFLGVIYERMVHKRQNEALESMYGLFYVWRRLGRKRLLLFAVWIICMYCCISSATIVTEDKIICRSFLHPIGIVHDYKDVTQIYTAFGQKKTALLEYKKKGNFYYQIKLDGKVSTFYTPSVNGDIERYEEDTYLELEDFDQKLVSLGIPKQSDEKGWEYCDLDKEYVERFRRIIHRQTKSASPNGHGLRDALGYCLWQAMN